MKEYRAKFFDVLRQKKISKGNKIFLYFIHNYKYEKGELFIEHSNVPYIRIDDKLKKIFNSIDKNRISLNKTEYHPNY